MRVVLADLKSHRGFVSKDTVVGGYGSRLDPFTRVTTVMAYLKKKFHDVPSVHMAYLAAILSRAGHDVKWTRGEQVDGDVALVLSSLVDHKSETAWADSMRARGVKVGFIGITASKMPHLFESHSDFILNGEPEAGVMRLAGGEIPQGNVISEQINDLELLQQSAQKSMASDVLRKLPAGFDQMLGRRFEGGVDLSGGEWQKVALARAYLRDAQVLPIWEGTTNVIEVHINRLRNKLQKVNDASIIHTVRGRGYSLRVN